MVCNFPGCSARLRRRNISGLCREHLHDYRLCKCQQCHGRRGETIDESASDDDVVLRKLIEAETRLGPCTAFGIARRLRWEGPRVNAALRNLYDDGDVVRFEKAGDDGGSALYRVTDVGFKRAEMEQPIWRAGAEVLLINSGAKQ